jgi:hypothetical protein
MDDRGGFIQGFGCFILVKLFSVSAFALPFDLGPPGTGLDSKTKATTLAFLDGSSWLFSLSSVLVRGRFIGVGGCLPVAAMLAFIGMFSDSFGAIGFLLRVTPGMMELTQLLECLLEIDVTKWMSF